MPTHADQPQSAFSIYKKTLIKQDVKKKRLKRIQSQNNLLKKSKKQNFNESCVKRSKLLPTLVNVDSQDAYRHLDKAQKVQKHNQKMKFKVSSRDKKVLIDNPLTEALNIFKWLISPISAEHFFETYWEQKAVHIQRSKTHYFTQIFDSTELDAILKNNMLWYSRNVDVVSYENGKKEVYNQEGRASASALWDYYSNGCSIRILNPQTYSSKVHLLISTLQEYFGAMVGANVYLTPPGSQGFAPHYDDIEAFVIQLEGRKHWKLYEPKDSDILARYSSPNLKSEDIGEPFMTLTLQAGEILYFPRGTIHEGYTDPKAHSLHITISVYQQTSYADLLEIILPSALKKASASDIRFRKGLPLNYLKQFGVSANLDLQQRTSVIRNVEELLHALVKHVNVDNAVDQLGKKLMHDSMPPVLSENEMKCSVKGDGSSLKNGKVINRVQINADVKIRLLRYYCVRLVIEDGSPPRLYYNTENSTVYHGEEEQWLELEHDMIPTIQMLQQNYPNYVQVDKLPLEDDLVKMQFVSDLWEHGLLVTEQPLDLIVE